MRYINFSAVAFFAAAFGIVYLFLTTRYKERMALIEKGANAGLFYSEKKLFNWSWPKVSLKIGMFLMGIATGIFLAALLQNTIYFRKFNEAALYFSSIFFFGGLSLVLSYIFVDRKKKEE